MYVCMWVQVLIAQITNSQAINVCMRVCHSIHGCCRMSPFNLFAVNYKWMTNNNTAPNSYTYQVNHQHLSSFPSLILTSFLWSRINERPRIVGKCNWILKPLSIPEKKTLFVLFSFIQYLIINLKIYPARASAKKKTATTIFICHVNNNIQYKTPLL